MPPTSDDRKQRTAQEPAVSHWIALGHTQRSDAWTAFLLLYVAYVAAYICRRNYGFWLSGLIQRGEMPQTQAAVFGSTMELAYGVGKLAAGPVADNMSPKRLLVLSLAAAAASNGLMFISGLFFVDVGLWAVNGFAQAFAWPALALVFFHWFGSSSARGTMYSVLSTNQNLGSAITPVLLTPLVARFGWRAALWVPALIGGTVSLLLIGALKERPDPAPEVKPPISAPKAKSEQQSESAAKAAPTGDTSWRTAVLAMLSSAQIWTLGLGYAFLTVTRVGISDWSLVFLKAHHHVSNETARDCLVALEVGGFVGGLAAGVLSDFAFGGRRGYVMILASGMVAAPAVLTIFSVSSPLALYGAYVALGLGTFGPHVLVGLVARELFPRAPSTAGSFAKSLAQIGGSLAGVPVSLAAERFGWLVVARGFAACCVLAALCFMPLLRLREKRD